jgi:hypothetical protein
MEAIVQDFRGTKVTARAALQHYKQASRQNGQYQSSPGSGVLLFNQREPAQFLRNIVKVTSIGREFLNSKSQIRQMMFIVVPAETGAEMIRSEMGDTTKGSGQD